MHTRPHRFARVANFAGGLPDRLLTRIPDFLLQRNVSAHDQYVERLAFYERARWDNRGERFLRLSQGAPPSAVETVQSSTFHGAERELLRFPSSYLPQQAALLPQFTAEAANLNAYVTLFRNTTPLPASAPNRPLVLCVHGFGMGAPSRAIRMFRVQVLLSLGMDVALFTQPCHWRRNAHYPGPEQMLRPQDVPMTVELFGQALNDLHDTVRMLTQRGYLRIGMIGASLGGYLAALYSSFPAPLSFIFMAVPAIDLADYLAPRSSLFDFPVDALLAEQTRRALERIAPLAQPRSFDVDKMCVVAHQGDRICPVDAARAFVAAAGIRSYVEVVGGHWVYLDRDLRGKTWYGWLAQHDFILHPRARS